MSCPFPHQMMHLDNFRHGAPRSDMERLRSEHRLLWQSDDYPAGGHWLVLNKDDIETVLRDSDRFSSRWGPLLDEFPSDLLEMQRKAMTFTDPPEHRKKRSLVDHAFRPDALESRRAMMQKKVDAIVDAIADKGRCEFVSEVAMPLPVHVTFRLLGVPEDDYEYLIKAINAMTLANDPDYAGSREEGFQASMDVVMWAMAFAAARRGDDRGDLSDTLLNSEVDGRPLSDEEYAVAFQGVIIGGTETTRNTLSWLFYELIRHPEQMALLQAEPERIPDAVEEILRYRNTVIYTRRTATVDTELAGESIKQGDKLVCLLSAVARDASLFDRPDRFDITRDPKHTRRLMRTFGFGPHACLGQHQARMNLCMMTEALLSRLSGFELLEEPVHFRSNFMDGFKRMPIRFKQRDN